MDYKDIEQLLERYWQCETSVEEEAALRDFFAREEVPAHLLRYKNLFVYQQVQQEVGLGETLIHVFWQKWSPGRESETLDTDESLYSSVQSCCRDCNHSGLGNVAQHSFSGDDGSVLATDTIGKQVTAPSVAISNDVKAEQVLADSLARVNHKVQVINE